MPLECETAGFDFKGRRPTGRVILEINNDSGKLSTWVQDLKVEKKYAAYIIFADGQKYVGINLGQITVNEKGKAENRIEIKKESLFQFNLADVLAVAITSEDSSGIKSPLCGYKEKSFSWIHSFSIAKKMERKVPEQIIETIIEPEIVPKPMVEEIPIAESAPEVEPISIIEPALEIIPEDVLTPPLARVPEGEISLPRETTD